MSTAAQIAANIANAQSSTGPRTEEGKAASSQNSTTYGIFAANDFIRPGEEADYADLADSLQSSLNPCGPLEQTLVGEIRRAMWRLSRCGEMEASFVAILTNGSDPIPDAMQNDATAKLQVSVDRARAQSHRLLLRCTAELRHVQTERIYRNEIFPVGTDLSDFGLADWRAITKNLNANRRDELRQMTASMNMPPPETPITERTQSPAPAAASVIAEIARNAPCPCHSGQKYKRCCGRTAPAILHAA